MSKTLIILEKEWLELRKERSLVLGALLPPLLLALLPIGIMYAVGLVPDEDTRELGAALADPSLAGMSVLELGQAVVGKQFSVLFLLVPLIVPSIVASYSIVGEKTGRTLEPLLATPVHTWELLLGKSLAALIPSAVVTWAGAAIFLAGTAAVAVSPRVLMAVISPGWALAVLLCTPTLALIMIATCVAISSRVNDPRTAQQISAVAVVPLLALFFGQLAGVVVLSPAFALGMALALALLAALGVWGAVALFQRETILTKWG
ncbi:MAG TPA: ABC transporter permease subunit [Roseiflexaceae bacterium]|nr:ABC transporter permease subunit [Roseiflexaceae bacterium]